jgi:tRNA A37 methylthiotransferase MiaB
MAELGDRLAGRGFAVSDGDEQVDICVINSCTVTANSGRSYTDCAAAIHKRT